VADAIPVPLGGLQGAMASMRSQPWAANLPTPAALLTRRAPAPARPAAQPALRPRRVSGGGTRN